LTIVLSGIGLVAIFIGLCLINAGTKGSANASKRYRNHFDPLGEAILVIGLALEAISILT